MSFINVKSKYYIFFTEIILFRVHICVVYIHIHIHMGTSCGGGGGIQIDVNDSSLSNPFFSLMIDFLINFS